MIRRLTLFVLLAGTTLSAQTESPVVGVGPFLHIVADLDRSVEFYHGKLGLALSRPVSDKFTDDPAVANLYGVPGKQFRAAVLKIPGSAMGIELVQWGEARKPRHKLVTRSGTAMLLLHRADVVEDRDSYIDPDGFPVGLKRSNSPGADLSLIVSDARKTAALYEKVLGPQPDLIQFTQTPAHLGGGGSFPAPGQGMLRVFVRNIDPLAASLKSAGFSVITTGGEPVTLPQGQRVIIMRDPNNFYLQLMQMK